MGEAHHADGDIIAGARGFVTSVAMNDVAFHTLSVIGALGAAVAWAFLPGIWEGYNEASNDHQQPSLFWPVTITVLGVLAVITPLGLQFQRRWVIKKLDEESTTEQAELVGWAKGYLTPAIEALPQVAVGGEAGKAALASIRATILGTLQAICGPSGVGVRAVWFEASGQTLSSKEWTGGVCKTKRRFVRRNADKAGTLAWERAATGLPVLYSDVINNPPEGYERGPNSTYETFISCGVLGSSDEVRGMLNVDAPRADDLTEIDATIVGVCAKVLGVAYSLSDLPGSV